MDISRVLGEQDALRAEAEDVYRDLRLDAVLTDVGTPTVVGSTALGVMVRRDLDVDVVCPRLDAAVAASVAGVGARLATHERVRVVTFRNDCGVWNQEPEAYPDGLYVGVECRTPAGAVWNLDIWFLDEPHRQPSTTHLTTLRPRLTDETRAAIIEIKQALAGRLEYGPTIRSFDVYRAVLDDGVRDSAGFETWVARERKTSLPHPGAADLNRHSDGLTA